MKRLGSLTLIVSLMAALYATPNAYAGAIGDPAAPLNITKWVKGEPVDLAAGKGKNVYLVEFWATWCGPCIASMPHLTEIQKKYEGQGLIVVGVTCPDDRGNTLENVQEFVKNNGGNMGYRVAFDGDRRTYEGYMAAFQKGGIPQAFFIDKDGKIAWEGHPMEADKFLEEHLMLASKYDPATYKRVVQVRELKTKYFSLAVSPANKGTVRALGKQIIQQGGDIPDVLTEFAWEVLNKTDMKVRELDQAVDAAKKAVDASKEQNADALAAYAAALRQTGKASESAAQQKKALDLVKDSAVRAQLEARILGQPTTVGK